MANGTGNVVSGLNFMLAFTSLFAAREQAAAQREQGDFDREAFLRNAELADIQAADARRRGKISASRFRSKGRKTVSSQRTAFAASGVDVSSASVAGVRADTELATELDAITIENNAFREAFGFQAEALQQRTAGEQARVSSRAQAGTTLITGGLQAAEFTTRGLSAAETKKRKEVPLSNREFSRIRTGNPRFNRLRGF